ncbi:MAG: hypothetical protein ACJAYU_003782 [Bradymonadia bacterium]|jgi:hypothetical protein
MDRNLLSLRELYPDEALAEWTPALIPKGMHRVRIQETGRPYDAWFGDCDSVLLSLAQEAGLGERESDVSGYLALRFAPEDAPFAAAAVRRATRRYLTVHGARRVSLCCSSLASDAPWGFQTRADASTSTATEFRGGVCEDDGALLVVVFAGSPDFSDGCVTWAGVVTTDGYSLW